MTPPVPDASAPWPEVQRLRRKAEVMEQLKAAGMRVYEDPFFQIMLVHGTLDAIVSVLDQAITEAKT